MNTEPQGSDARPETNIDRVLKRPTGPTRPPGPTQQLETEIDRVLKGLPDLPAPTTLVPRVMAALESRARLPWYRQAWTTWPQPARVAALAVLAVMFGGLCFAGWELSHAQTFAAATQTVGGWFSGLGSLWKALNVLVGAVGLVVKQLGTTFILACLVAVGLGYALCVGLGTVYLRLALARR